LELVIILNYFGVKRLIDFKFYSGLGIVFDEDFNFTYNFLLIVIFVCYVIILGSDPWSSPNVV